MGQKTQILVPSKYMLKDIFIQLANKYCNDKLLVNECWKEIEINYSKKKRYYHTLKHVENVYAQLEKIKSNLEDWDTILFTLFYHDIIYSALKKDNEEQSVSLAKRRMIQLGVTSANIEKCKNQISATKQHLQNADSDTNYFTDADLSILGVDWEQYFEYFNNVRKEYSIYPNIIYNPERKKVLQHFLDMVRIYKTNYFYDKFEMQAKLNMQKEITLL
jgi:predicted metal-dependent HD superfamily phosphohydrolase